MSSQTNGENEIVGDVVLVDGYWDCECESGYIHPASENSCTICHAYQCDQPNSRLEEVLLMIFSNKQ